MVGTFAAVVAVGGTAPAVAAGGVTAAAAAVAASAAIGARDAGFVVASVACAEVAIVVTAADCAAAGIVGEHVHCLVDECGPAHLLSSDQGYVGLVQALDVATVFGSGVALEMELEWDPGFAATGLPVDEAGEVPWQLREGRVWPGAGLHM